MKFNFKIIVAAVAIAASSAANAAVDLFPTGNSSLSFIALDSNAPISIFVDLNYNLNDFLPTSSVNTPNTTISWNFNNNSLTVNGVAQTGNFAWSNPFATFASAATGPVSWAVIAGDTASPRRFITTGTPVSQAQLDAQTLSLSSNMGLVNTLYSANSFIGTHTTVGVDAGASTATSGLPYVGTAGSFGTLGQWAGTNLQWTAFAAAGASNQFSFINVQPRSAGSILPTVTTYGLPNVDNVLSPGPYSTFSYDAGVLTWTTPVPEPSTYAMLLAGFAALGFMVRRRRS